MTAVLVACGVCSGAEAPTYATLYQFTGYLGGPDGSFPIAPVVIGPGGVLYGTAGGGGVSGYGTVFSLRPPAGSGGPWTMSVSYTHLDVYKRQVFSLTPPASQGAAWTESVLLSFSYRSGESPDGGLAIDKAGNLYGTCLLYTSRCV